MKKKGIVMKISLFVLISLSLFFISNSAAAASGDYCESKSRSSNYFWQESISAGEVLVHNGNNGGYSYTQTPELELEQGTSTLYLNPGYRSNNYTLHWRGWMDADGDMQFSSEEQLFEIKSNGPVSVPISISSNNGIENTTLRIAMKYGSYPQPCEVYYLGETEDLSVAIQQAGSSAITYESQYHLTADHDFTLHRTGSIGDRVNWVIERNGTTVLERNAAGSLDYRYNRNSIGSDFRVWLDKFIDGSYQRVSNIIEYTPGTTDQYALNLQEGFEVNRSGQIGDAVTWVIERDGNIVLQRSASSELSYVYYKNADQSKYRVWLKKFINGQYQIVSNIIEYEVGQTEFTVTIDQLNQLRRNGQPGDAVSWIIEQDGQIVLERSARDEMTYTYFDHVPGSTYRVWLQMYLNGQYQTVSNIVEYTEPAAYDYTLSLGPKYEINRSGQLGDSLTWVIIKDNNVVLQRNAANELRYTYFRNTNGSSFKVYLTKFIGGYYRRVSNIIEYTIGDVSYDLAVDQNYLLTRSGQIGDPATWVIEEDGEIVLQRNASNELSYTYFNNKPGSSYQVWLKQYIDGAYQVVSNTVSYSVPVESNDYTLTLGSNYAITRSGALGDSVNWVIIKDGKVALKRKASNELTYTYYRNTVGSTIQVYLEKYINGSYRQVSNTIQYTVN